MMSYLGNRKGEFLLVLLSAWAVTCVALNGFFLDSLAETYGYAFRLVLAFGLDLVLCLTLYLAAGTRGNHVTGALMVLVVVAALVLGAFAMSVGESLYDDAEGNYLYLALVAIFSSVACFLLTRTLAGSMVWFVAAAFTCSLIQAFYLCNELVLSLVATMSALALVVYCNFRKGVQGAQLGGGKKAGWFALPAAVAPVLAAAAIACFAWFFIIAPLNPGVIDIKLITEYRMLPIEIFKGTAEQTPEIDTSLTSDQVNEKTDPYTTDQFTLDETSDYELKASSSQQQMQGLGASDAGSGGSSGGGITVDLDDRDDEDFFDAFSYSLQLPWVLLWFLVPLLIIALIVAYFVIRRRRREKRLVEYLSHEPADQIRLLYRFICDRLARLGFKQPDGMTLREFAKTSAHSMDMLTEETKVSFRSLTETYMAVVYGDYEPTEDDVVPFVAYYLRFWKAAYVYLGKYKYFFKSFRL